MLYLKAGYECLGTTKIRRKMKLQIHANKRRHCQRYTRSVITKPFELLPPIWFLSKTLKSYTLHYAL